MYFPGKIFSGTASLELSKAISHSYGQGLGKVVLDRFKDGEMQPSFEETVRGCNVYIIQSTHQPIDNFFELLLMADAAKRASARRVVAVIPYYGYARQDRKDKPRVPIGAKLMANLLESAGIHRVITMDLHADQIQGFFNVPVDHIYASAVFVPYIKKLQLDNLIVASPDTGGTKRARAYAECLGTGMVICYKQRERANVVGSIKVIGDVKGKNVILVDDIIDTAGTIAKASDMLMEQGALSVRALITHPVLSSNAYEKIENSKITELVVTNTIPLKKQSDKIKVLNVGSLFGEVIKNVNNYESISTHFIF